MIPHITEFQPVISLRYMLQMQTENQETNCYEKLKSLIHMYTV